MTKYVILFFNTIALLIYQLFFTDGITVTQKAPASAKIGITFTVEVTIHKGDVDGFAKLQQDLPDGFTAEEGITNGGSFTFSNNAVKFIWMALPADKEFKVTYKVKVDNTVIPGDKFIAGKFSYIVNNAKQQVEIAPLTINVPSEVTPTETQPLASNTSNTEITDNLVSVSGYYYDNKDLPIQGLKVNLKNSAGVVLESTTTDSTGFFVFSKLPKDNAAGLSVVLAEDDTHLIGPKSKAQVKDSKDFVLETKDLKGNAIAENTATQPVATNNPATPATNNPETNAATQPKPAANIDNSVTTCQRNAPTTTSENLYC